MFITFEGIDGGGKTTQIELLSQSLKDKGFKVLETREPGGSRAGRAIRKMLLDPDNIELTSPAETLLFIADRIQHLQEVILPALKRGEIVICDRYHDSTIAYQGGGRKMELSWLEPIRKNFIKTPDLTLWLDISVDESRKRLENNQDSPDCRMENENRLFFSRVRQAYQEIQSREPERFIRVVAEKEVEVVQHQILDITLNKLD